MRGRIRAAIAVAAGTLAVSACGGDDGGGGAVEGGVEGSEAAVEMQGVNESSEFGTASLFSEDGDKTRVLMDTDGPFDREFEQPAAIYKGTCPTPSGEPAYDLGLLTDGFAETTIDASLEELRSGGFIIVVHKSASDDTVTQCGTIAGA